MEPVGILQFLQSLIATPLQNQEPSQNSAPPVNNEKTPDEHHENTPIEQNRSAQDAVLRFLESHEKRANKWKK